MSPNRSSNMSCMQEILNLAKILRKDGDQVLNGSSKLSLSTKLLHNLNDAFTLIIEESKELESSFQVCNSSEIDFFRDLKFLHDFVQKIIWLKIVHTNNDSRISIDITKFRHLRYLELQKVCIDLVNGIQGIRGQLETITCTGGGGVGTIGRLLAACGGDDGVGFVWASLKRLSLPYNGLGRLDKSLELAPWLQTLDLSHNFISSATELDCIPSLKFVNLGYNKLENIPAFNKSTYRSLQVLVLKHNYIDNIDGLQGLDFLAELDLSFNCLSDHNFLWPIGVMTSLLCLDLTGNPLTYHSRHRSLTCKYLHSSLAENKFILDNCPLSKSEKLIVGENRSFTIKSFPTLFVSDSNSLDDDTTHFLTDSLMNPSQGSRITAQQSPITNNLDIFIPKIRRIANVKEVSIADDIERDGDGKINDAMNKLENFNAAMSMDHLETKKQILALRKKFGGENWLSSHGGSFIQEIMGIDRSCDPIVASATNMNSSSSPKSCSSSKMFSTIDNECCLQSDIAPNDGGNESNTEEHIEESNEGEAVTTNDETVMEPEEYSDSIDYHGREEEEGEVFLVKRTRDNENLVIEDIFLIVSPTDVKERDPITGKIINRWSIDIILSCVMGRGELTTIEFTFDTTRRDRQFRTYHAESENDASKAVKVVNDLLKTRSIILKIFECMKCSTHFSQDSDTVLDVNSMALSQPKLPICPSCKSTLVIQTDDFLTPDIDDKNQKIEAGICTSSKSDPTQDHEVNTSLQHSTSQSSIGGKKNEAKSIATSITYSESSQQAQVCCTATSLDDSRESTPSIGTVMKKCESDIEILSNPSQSSIEVLDDGTKSSSTPNRKRSSEERRIAVAPTLITIPDTTHVTAGLTESSSSGSLTDSICTTYENDKMKRTSSMTIMKTQINAIKESGQTELVGNIKNSTYSPVANLTSMLGGLLQSMKIGANKESPAKLQADSDSFSDNIRYSYTNFTSVDHRIKLHLILNTFELENEELVLFLRTDILMQNYSMPFPGCLVLSTSKIYVLRIIGAEGEDPQQWLQKEISWTMDRLRMFAPLPFKQGVLMILEQPRIFSEEPTNISLACILQDFQRTSNLLLHLSDLSLPISCEVAFSVPEQCTTTIHDLMLSSKHHRAGDTTRIFAVFSSASLQLEAHEAKIQIGGLLVTTSSLILLDDKIHWLLSHPDETASKFAEQPISNLIEVVLDGFSVALNFFDEIPGIEELWILTFISDDAANAVIDAIQLPWEDLFSVPLQIIKKNADETK